MSTVREIEAALEKLPPEQQRQVAAWLAVKLGPTDFDAALEEEWGDEIKRRVEEVDSGKVRAIPSDAVFNRAACMLRLSKTCMQNDAT